MSKAYAIYNANDDSFWYNEKGACGFASWTDNFNHSQLKHTLGDAFKTCCKLYEKDMLDLSTLVIVEVTEDGVDFENPIWIGSEDKMFGLWMEVEPELKPLVVRGLFEDGLQRMYRVVSAWYMRKV